MSNFLRMSRKLLPPRLKEKLRERRRDRLTSLS
jgi:hypothetical protein